MKIDNEPVYNCPDCQDTGYASVIDPVYWPASLRSVAVTCRCGEGDKRKTFRENDKRIKRKPVARLSNRMAIFRPGMNRQDAAEAIAAAMAVVNHPNYTDFGDYSHEQQEAF
jgi:hypothetical protein